jgi:hypothetical protein
MSQQYSINQSLFFVFLKQNITKNDENVCSDTKLLCTINGEVIILSRCLVILQNLQCCTLVHFKAKDLIPTRCDMTGDKR